MNSQIDFSLSLAAISYNQPKFCPNASWNPNATTFANNVTVGNTIQGIFINTYNTIFVARRDTGQILIWTNGSVSPTSSILANLTTPSCLFVSGDDHIFADNQASSRVDRWMINQTQLPSPMLLGSNYCSGLFVDIQNTLYCSHTDKDRVLSKSLNNTVNVSIVVAGNGSNGFGVYMLAHPHGIFVTTQLNLYVADTDNDRIQLFRSGELNATTVAGNGSNGTVLLRRPIGIVLDADGYLFIVDGGNFRIVGSGPNGFRCLVACSGSAGSTLDTLNQPRALSFDTYGNIFVTDRATHQIQKFLLTSNLCGK